MALLLKQRGGETNVTEGVVKAATNRRGGAEVMVLFLKQRVEGFQITQGLATERGGG